MMNDDYQDFTLALTWQPPESEAEEGRISVGYVEGEVTCGPVPYMKSVAFGNTDKLFELMNASDMDKAYPLSFLREAGETVANLLLPDDPALCNSPESDGVTIRSKFREVWQENDKVRLRLKYPNPELTQPKEQVVQLSNILRIPWELIYLPREAGDQPENPGNFLGRRNDISIVHTVRSQNEPRNAAVPLKVRMEYLSWLDANGNQNEDKRLFQDFLEERDRLETLVTVTNLSSSEPVEVGPSTPLPGSLLAEPEDVLIALRNTNLLHLISHGDAGSMWLKDDTVSISELILELSERIQGNENAATAVLLISCNSGDGVRSVAAALHQAGIPVVIGMTRWIPVEQAGHFVDGFYKALAAWPDEGIETAIVNGRRSMFREGPNRNEWYGTFCLPRLFLNSPTGKLIALEDLFGGQAIVTSFDSYVTSLTDRVTILALDNNLDKVTQWVNQNEGRAFFVTGRPGSGKSTLIAKLIKELQAGEAHKAIYHFCRFEAQSGPSHPGDPLAFVRYSLVPQLIKHYGDDTYRSSIRPGRFPLLVGNADQALREFVLEPLRIINAQEGVRPPIIIIDDIDYFRDGFGFEDSILKLLVDHWDDLINVARFVIAADVMEPKANEELAELLGEPDLPLIAAEVSLNKIQERLSDEAKENVIRPAEEIVGNLIPSYRPLPLFYQMVYRFGRLSLKFSKRVPLEIAASPQGVQVLYDYGLKAVYERFADDKEKIRDLLAIVALAYEPLSPCDIAGIIDVDCRQVLDWLEVLWPFLKDDANDGKLVLFHPSLQDYLLRTFQLESSDEMVPQEQSGLAVHAHFANAFHPIDDDWTKVDWANLQGTVWWEHVSDDNATQKKAAKSVSLPFEATAPQYVRRYLALHAYEVYRRSRSDDAAKNFLTLVCDAGFRTVRLAEVGLENALQDIRNALRVAYTQYVLSLSNNGPQTVEAIDRLSAAANDPIAYQRLIDLEQQLRLDDNSGVSALFAFLSLSMKQPASAA